MSHVNSVAPPGPLTVAPGSTTRLTVNGTGGTPDKALQLNLQGSDGAVVVVNITVDYPDLKLVFGGTAPLADNEIRVTATGGTAAPVAGIALGVDWTAPA